MTRGSENCERVCLCTSLSMRDVRIRALLPANYDAEVRREGARIDRGKHVEGSCVAAGDDDGGCDQ